MLSATKMNLINRIYFWLLSMKNLWIKIQESNQKIKTLMKFLIIEKVLNLSIIKILINLVYKKIAGWILIKFLKLLVFQKLPIIILLKELIKYRAKIVEKKFKFYKLLGKIRKFHRKHWCLKIHMIKQVMVPLEHQFILIIIF